MRALIYIAIPVGSISTGFIFFYMIYLTALVFAPYLLYGVDRPGYEPTIFSEDELGLHFVLAHTVVVAMVVAYLTLRKKFLYSFAVYVGITAFASVSAHLVLNLIGFEYYIEVP